MKIYNTILNEYSKNIKICIRMGDKLFGKEVKISSFLCRKLVICQVEAQELWQQIPLKESFVKFLLHIKILKLYLHSQLQKGDQLSWLERLHGMQEVIGSTPIFSTLLRGFYRKVGALFLFVRAKNFLKFIFGMESFTVYIIYSASVSNPTYFAVVCSGLFRKRVV